jgi:hypothetical protein
MRRGGEGASRIVRAVIAVWRGVREWSGDDAYERYLAAHAGHGHAVLSRRDFYHAYFIARAARPRCC